MVGGEAVAYLERNGRSLLTFPAAAEHHAWPFALRDLLTRRALRQIEITKINGEPANSSPLAIDLCSLGFVEGYRGLVMRCP